MKKHIALLSLALLAVGCQDKSASDAAQVQSDATQPAATQAATNTQPSSRVLKVATTANQPPFTYMDEKGGVVGMDIDIIKAIAQDQGFEVSFDLQPWPNVFPSVEQGQNDLAISGISYNDERAQKYTLSDKYLFVPSAIMVKEPSDIKKLQDLQGKNFSCMTGAKQCKDIEAAVPNAHVTDEKTTFVTFQSLVQGKTDAIGEDMQLLQYFAKKHPEQHLSIYPYEDENNPQSSQVIMMKKGQDELVEKINASIAKLSQNGTIAQIEKKWLESPL